MVKGWLAQKLGFTILSQVLGFTVLSQVLSKQKRLIKMLVIVTEYHFFSGERQPKLKIKDVKVNFWKTTFM